jgi:hypothetical protein
MKTLQIFLVFLLASRLTAADLLPAQLLQIGEQPVTPVAGSLISGQRTTLLFYMAGPAATRGEVVGDLLQVSGGVAAPLLKDLPLRGDPLALDIELPPLARETSLFLLLRARPRAGEPWQALGQFSLTAFPANFTAEMAEFARWVEKERRLPLAVFGKAGPLHDFLEASGVPFVNLGAEIPTSLPRPMLVLGSGAFSAKDSASRLATTTSPVVFFASDSPLLPGVYPRSGDGFTLVTLPLLSNLAKDPRPQKTLLEILRSVCAAPSPMP